MKRSLQIVGLAGLLALPVAAQAQTTKSVSFGASGGLSLPMGDLGDGAEAGFTVAGHVFLKPASMKKLSLRADVSYDSWGAKGAIGQVADGSLSSLGFVGNVIFPVGDEGAAMRPYLLAGGGMYRTKASYSVLGFSGSASSTDAGIQAGGGFEFKLSGFSTFLEAKFVNVFGDGSSSTYIPISFGVRF
jgi:hypothetical protein